MYYKIINNNSIVGIASENDFRRYQGKHGVILYSDEDRAEYVEINGVLYRDDWLKTPVAQNIDYITSQIQRITKEEYDILAEAFETQDEIQVEPEEPEEEPIAPDDNPTLEFVKENKIKQMSNICRETIIQGFDIVLSDGETHHFSLEIEDQIKIQALALKAQNGETVLPWHSDGELCVFFSSTDILRIYTKLEELQTYHTTYFNSLRFYIESMEDIQSVGAVQYGMEIPEQYQSEVLKYLIGQNNEDDI